MKAKVRTALREMLVIGLGIGIVMLLVGRNVRDAAGITSCLLAGLLFSPLGWAVYRFGRFVLTGSSASSRSGA